MKLRRLNKHEDSYGQGQSPAMYVAEDPAFMVGQGWVLDDETAAELREVVANERGVLIPTETVLRGAGLLLAEHGRPAMKQYYSSDVEDAALARFIAGEPHGVDLSWTIDKVTAQVAAGRTWTNVRVVVEPPNDYTRLELTVYPEWAAAGEDVRIISVPERSWPEGIPQHDYWLFDDRDVWLMHYDDKDRHTGAELLTDGSVIADHLRWRDAALAQAIPLHEYLAMRKE